MTLLRVSVSVPVTTLWTSPEAPRSVDALAVADTPDPKGWLAVLDAHPDDDESGDGRLGLHGRIHTQAVAGEPVQLLGTDASGDWVQVLLPWQPSQLDPRGYPGWLRRAHLEQSDDGPERAPQPDAPAGTDVLDLAREHLGLPYLWGGMSALGLDCSGLVHYVWRRFGVIVPRDADDQQAAAYPVALGDERPGDLYFFAHPGKGVHHVGIVSGLGRMLHAPETGRLIVEEPLGPARESTLHSAGRLPWSGALR